MKSESLLIKEASELESLETTELVRLGLYCPRLAKRAVPILEKREATTYLAYLGMHGPLEVAKEAVLALERLRAVTELTYVLDYASPNCETDDISAKKI